MESSREPVLRAVDAVTLSVPDLDVGIRFYSELGHRLLWRNDAIGQAALGCPDSTTEIVLSTQRPAEANWLVRDAAAAAAAIVAAGGRIESEPTDIPVGRVAVAQDPFGNRLVLVDLTKGRYQTDATGHVTGVTPPDSS